MDREPAPPSRQLWSPDPPSGSSSTSSSASTLSSARRRQQASRYDRQQQGKGQGQQDGASPSQSPSQSRRRAPVGQQPPQQQFQVQRRVAVATQQHSRSPPPQQPQQQPQQQQQNGALEVLAEQVARTFAANPAAQRHAARELMDAVKTAAPASLMVEPVFLILSSGSFTSTQAYGNPHLITQLIVLRPKKHSSMEARTCMAECIGALAASSASDAPTILNWLFEGLDDTYGNAELLPLYVVVLEEVVAHGPNVILQSISRYTVGFIIGLLETLDDVHLLDRILVMIKHLATRAAEVVRFSFHDIVDYLLSFYMNLDALQEGTRENILGNIASARIKKKG